MSKCVRCGSSFLGRRKVKLKDADICGKCLKELGFDKHFFYVSNLYSFDKIKDGYETYFNNELNRISYDICVEESKKLGVTPEQYSYLRDIDATNMEKKIFATIYALLEDEGRDADDVGIGLGDNGSVRLMLNGEVFIRYKAADSVKWITFENESPEKIRISGAARLNSFADRIVQAYDSAAL